MLVFLKRYRSIAFIILLRCLPVGAVVPCFHNDLKDFGKLTQKTAEYADSGSHRETVDEYADSHHRPKEQVQAAVAATGKLLCAGGRFSSANLIVKGDTIVGAGHALVDRETCETVSKASECSFVVEGQKPIKVERLLATGIKCPAESDVNTDWAIFKLSKPVVGVKPYKLAKDATRAIDPEKRILVVGAQSIDFHRKNAKTGKMEMPRHMQDCAVKRLFYRYNPIFFGSNCDGSLGKSGGAVLNDNVDEPELLGITVAVKMTPAEIAREKPRVNPCARITTEIPGTMEASYSGANFLDAARKATE